MSRSTDYLFRYTSLESLRSILCTKSLTLLDYREWKDKNDSHFMCLYERQRRLKCLLAICFTSSWEQFHLWEVFRPKRERCSIRGIRQLWGRGNYKADSPFNRIAVQIQFNRSELVKAIGNLRGVAPKDVKYMNLNQLKALANGSGRDFDPTRDLPFIKRKGFEDESEFRIIFESEVESAKTKTLPITIPCIHKVLFSYKLSPASSKAIQNDLQSIEGWENLRCELSHLTDSKRWKDAGDKLVEAARRKRQAQHHR